MENNIRITCAVNKVRVADPIFCMEEVLEILDNCPHDNTDIFLFPRLALCSPSSRSLLKNSYLAENCKTALDHIREKSHNTQAYYIIGLCGEDLGQSVSEIAVIYNGRIVLRLPATENSPYLKKEGFSQHYDDADSTLLVGNMRLQIFTDDISQLVKGAYKAAENHCNILLVPIYEPMVAGKAKELSRLAKELSQSLGIGVVIVNGGVGDTSSPDFYHGFISAYEAGQQLVFKASSGESLSLTFDMDSDILRSAKIKSRYSATPYLHKINPNEKDSILRYIKKNPFLPENKWEKTEYMAELFFYQTRALAQRVTNTGLTNLVLGVSGGIDSTSALMVAVAACDSLDLPRTNIYCITLPAMGTSDRTYLNALSLLEQLGVTHRDISITSAVKEHFKDIGHTGVHDTTYENAQARERTQVLLDISNMVGGLVVGTGDLSEEALGFSTFGGDHLAGYNVNSCMTKTMLREQLAYIIESGLYPETHTIIKDVLNTPISPELLPPLQDGSISQKTEDILGPYELHEFFLYYFVAYNMPPSKIYMYACHVFKETMDKDFIREKLKLFIKKFCANQFKRSCAPDAAAITSVNLLGNYYDIPSDLSANALLEDLEQV